MTCRSRTNNILLLIIDGLDKTKGCWPQWTFRTSKDLSTFNRPRICVHLAIAHGYCCDFYLTDDEDFFHGASTLCEMVTRTLARVKAICECQGLPFPEHFILQSDNTPAQAKNQEMIVFLAALVRKYKFKTTSLMFLRVGHTHIDVDFLPGTEILLLASEKHITFPTQASIYVVPRFSILLALVLRRFRFKVPEELRLAILAGMAQTIGARGEMLHCELLSHTRNFQVWLRAMGAHPYNCLKPHGDKDCPHSFVFKMRMDLTAKENSWLAREPTDAGWSSKDPSDVFCIVKSFMSSTEANGPPVLVIPSERFQRLTQAPSGTCYATKPMSDDRRNQLRALANKLQVLTGSWSPEHSYFEAAKQLRELADGRDKYVSQDGFLEGMEAPRHVPVEEHALPSAYVPCSASWQELH